MALMVAPTGGQLTDIRSDNHYRALQFVCLAPNTVIVKFQPSVAPSSSVYAEITVGSIISGSMSNVREGMTVVFSTTSDVRASETFRTRVRKVSGTSSLFTAENSQTLTTSHYVTVINSYEIVERLRRSDTLVDWEITFRKLLPIETALPTAKVVSNGGTSWSPTAVPKAMDASASGSFTHAWESSNGSDSIASSTTASPTITLAAGAFRWIRYTFTDSNGNSNYRVIAVWTVPKNYSAGVALSFSGAAGDVADIAFDAELGWSATVPAFDGIDTVLDKTFCVIATDEWINGSRQSIRTNINMVGWLQTESTATAGDEQDGVLSETRFTIEGAGHQLARQNIAPIRVTRVTGAPTAWNEIQNPTPARMLTYHLTEGSTLFNLCSMTIPADDTDFIGDDLTLSNSKALDDIRFIAEVINAELQFDYDGRLDLCRNLNFQDDTARNAAPVAVTFEPSDLLAFNYDYDYSKTCSQATITGGRYDTSLDRYDVFEAIAPAVARGGEGDPQEVVNQVLTTDASIADALTEISDRASNFFAANNPTYMAQGTLKAEWWFLLPDIGSWVKFNIAGSDTVRGKVFSSADRWQFVSWSFSTNNITGDRQIDFTARHETQSTGAMVRARQVIEETQTEVTYYPATTLPYTGIPTGDGTFYDSLDTQSPRSPNPPPSPDCQLVGLRPKKGVAVFSTSIPTLYVSVAVRGSGQISATSTTTDEMTAGLDADTHEFSATYPFGVVNAGAFTNDGEVGGAWQATDGRGSGGSILSADAGGGIGQAGAVIDLGSDQTVTAASFWLKHIVHLGASNELITFWDASKVMIQAEIVSLGNTPTYTQRTWTGSVAGVRYVSFQGHANTGGELVIDDLSVTIGSDTQSDAFFYTQDGGATWHPHEVGDGLYIEDDQPIVTEFNPDHEYFIPSVQIQGLATVELEFRHASFDLSGFDNWAIQALICNAAEPL